MALAMFSTAMRMQPAATVSGWPCSDCASSSNFRDTTPASSGSSPRAPNKAGKKSGWMRPRSTLQSVTVSGPPRRYAAGPGFAPADSGPTRSRTPSKRQIEPPPAATVWMRRMGVRKRTPLISTSSARS